MKRALSIRRVVGFGNPTLSIVQCTDEGCFSEVLTRLKTYDSGKSAWQSVMVKWLPYMHHTRRLYIVTDTCGSQKMDSTEPRL